MLSRKIPSSDENDAQTDCCLGMHAYAWALVLSVALTPPFAPHGDANAWYGGHVNEIALLPFPAGDGLLPGETLQIHHSEPHQVALFEASMRDMDGCVGQLLERPAATDSTRSYCAVAPLLELREHRACDAGGVWCSYTCLGAVRLSAIELRTPEEQRALRAAPSTPEPGVVDAGARESSEPFLVAAAALVREEGASVDYDSADDEEAFLAAEVCALHEEVNELRRRALELNADGPLTASDRITSGGERIGPPPAADDRVTDGHYRLGPLIGPYLTIDELLRLRREGLEERGVDGAALATGNRRGADPARPPGCTAQAGSRLHELWGTPDGEGLRRRLLSFVAVEGLDEHCRVAAMAIDETTARLQHAQSGLIARRAALVAEVALRRVSKPGA